MTATEELTYNDLEQLFKEQDRLVAEGKMQRPQIVYGFTPEGRREFNLGITWEQVFGNNLKKMNNV